MVFSIDARIAPVVLVDVINVDVVGCFHVQETRFRIEGGAAPISATSVGGPHEGAPQTRRRKDRAESKLFHVFECERLDFGRQIVGVLQGNALWSEGGRL